MTYSFKPAKRQDTKVLIGLYGESGRGKTFSALLLARGMAGEQGKVAMIDTESGRGSLYADRILGGYEIEQMVAPFSPASYIKAIEAAEKEKVDVLIIDSMSHEWEGIGGVTDMAASSAKARADRYNKEWDNVIQFGDWKHPKSEHQKLMLKLLQSKMNIICCLRAKYKSRQVKNEKGKSEIVKDDYTTPIQAEDFIYEMTAHMEIMEGHAIRITKCSHPDLAKCFDNGKPITMDNGKRIAQWAKGSASNPNIVPLDKDEWDNLENLITGAVDFEMLQKAKKTAVSCKPRMSDSEYAVAIDLYNKRLNYLKQQEAPKD